MKPSAGRVLVVVNKGELTEAELDRMLAAHQARDAVTPAAKRRFLDQMIEGCLIRQFLAKYKTTATKQEIDDQLADMRDSARRRGENPDQALGDAGFSAEFLRDEIGLRLAWRKHVDRAVTADQLKACFDAHRAEFDGTQLRASHIFLKVEATAPDSEWQAADDGLKRLHEAIDSRQTSFEEAAKKNSQAPTRDKGGDVGYFPYSGRMPEEFSRTAFALKVGEMSRPFRTKFGMHLCLVTERRPGDLSLEDVRDEVLARVSQELWDRTVAELRKSAKIEWRAEFP